MKPVRLFILMAIAALVLAACQQPAGPGTAPAAPTNVQASFDAETGDITVTWDASANADSYTVWRAMGDTFVVDDADTLADDVTGTTYTDADVEDGVYIYAVTATNEFGTSAPGISNVVDTTDGGPVDDAPAAPTNVNASVAAGSSDVNLTWSASTGADTYTVWRAQGTSFDVASAEVIADDVTDTNFTDAGLEDGQYIYAVTATNEFGTSAPGVSNAVTVPGADVDPTACEAGDDCTLNFTGDEGGLEETGFTMTLGTAAQQQLDLVSVENGNLVITTTSGIMFQANNSQVNALGVDVAEGETVTISTSVIGSLGTTFQYQQAGLWYGHNQDNYAKLVLINDGDVNQIRVQLLVENAGLAPVSQRANSQPVTIGADTVLTLSMTVDPTTGTVTGSYSIDGGTVVNLGPVTVADTFTGDVDNFAGVHATHRNAAAALDVPFGFFSKTYDLD